MLQYWIWFAQLDKVSDHAKQTLLQRFRDPEDIYHAQIQALAQIEGLTEDNLSALDNKDLTQAQQIAALCRRKGIQILTYHDPSYPAKLRNIYDPPMMLYFTGTLPAWEEMPVIGIVGTRKATPYGMNTAQRFGGQISACGALVVSGCATGIDTMAMEGALQTGGAVVGVLGCGVDVVYPAKNKPLFEKVKSCGCLISEFPPETKPLPWHFLQRNRIITGISNGLLVVEAPERSGALNSARHAMEQGRDVFVVPGNVDVAACAGSNALLEEQALPALSGWHVVREYEAIYPGKVQKRDIPVKAERMDLLVAQVGEIPKMQENADKKSIDKKDNTTYSVVNNPPAGLNAQEQQILALIGDAPCAVDQVIARSDMTSAAVRSILTKLTVKGLVQPLPGGRIQAK